MEVLVFKTDVIGRKECDTVGQVLLGDPRIKNWNIDNDDLDHVLRIESSQMSAAEVIEIMTRLGHVCEELPD